MTSATTSLLRLPPYLSVQDARQLRTDLEQIWLNNFSHPPGSLEEDLTSLRHWFDPVAQGARLRRNLAGLAPLTESLEDPGEPWTIQVSRGRLLLTPEGRCCLDLLRQLLGEERDEYAVPQALLVDYDRILASTYRDWSRHRLLAVTALLAGTTKPLQIPAAGVVIALMVNRCTDESRALTRFASGEPREIVDAAFFAPVQDFADILAPRRRGNRGDPRLVSGWMLYEARRRLGEHLVIVDARGGVDGKVWVTNESAAIEVLTRDLVRGHRKHATPERFAVAFDALVERLRAELARLAGFGLVYERPAETRRLRERLLRGLAKQVAVQS